MESRYLYSLKDRFIKNGYFYEKTKLNYVTFAMYSYDDYANVVIFCENNLHEVSSKLNTEHLKEILSTDLRIPAFMRVNYLVVVINDSISNKYRAKNTVEINTLNNQMVKWMVSAEFEREMNIIKSVVDALKREDIVHKNKYGCIEIQYKPWITYIIVVFTFIMFVFFNNKELLAKTSDILNKKEYYRLFTYILVHANIIHLLGNMGILLITGPTLERKVGSAKFLIIYAFSGIYGGIFSLQNNLSNFQSSVGASGAIYGILGAIITTYLIKHENVNKAKVLGFSLKVFLIFISGFLSFNADNMCHLGGLLCGTICGLLFALCDKIEDNIYSIRMLERKEKRGLFYAD